MSTSNLVLLDSREFLEALRAGGLVDTHYHIGPELLPRRYNVAALAKVAREWNATLVLKNHTYPTTPLASLARSDFGARLVGSVVLNRFVGGLNPDAVFAALSGNRSRVSEPATDDDPFPVVWLPTVHAEAHLRVLGHAFDPRWSGGCGQPLSHSPGDDSGEVPVVAFDSDLKPTRPLLTVLEAVAQTQCRLATGHLSAKEIVKLVPLALDYGVPIVIITHPHYPAVRLADQQLRALVKDPRVFVEHCLAVHTIEGVPLLEIADSIRSTGPEQVLVASDFGQICSEPFPDGTFHYAPALARLLAGHLNDDDILSMFRENGFRALGLKGQQ